jgi:hypothetical protein
MVLLEGMEDGEKCLWPAGLRLGGFKRRYMCVSVPVQVFDEAGRPVFSTKGIKCILVSRAPISPTRSMDKAIATRLYPFKVLYTDDRQDQCRL